jgi:hypothetical protein
LRLGRETAVATSSSVDRLSLTLAPHFNPARLRLLGESSGARSPLPSQIVGVDEAFRCGAVGAVVGKEAPKLALPIVCP